MTLNYNTKQNKMETRIIKTKIYRDKIFRKLSFEEKFITLYLLTNEYLECLPAVLIDIEILAFNANTTPKKLVKLINEKLGYFEIYYIDDFLIVGDKFTYANYRGGKTAKKKKELYDFLPSNIKKILSERGEIGQLLPNHCSIIEHINHKSEIINHKSKNIKQKPEIKNQKQKNEKQDFETEKEDLELLEIMEHYNTVFRKKITSTQGFKNNYLFWAKIHDKEKIKLAITNGAQDNFWRNKLTLTILFRKKNPRGENVDYIEDLSNRTISNIGNANNPYAVRAEAGKYDDLLITVIDN